MALYEDILGAIDAYKPSQQQGDASISLKITPVTPTSAGASPGTAAVTASGTPEALTAGGAGAPSTAAPPVQLSPAQQAQLTRNPQLPSTPLGAFTDARYEAEIAQARQQYMQSYLDVLRQLGWMDEAGQFVPGQIQIGAERQQSDFYKGLEQAINEVTQGAQRGGTLFSGRRAYNQSQAEHPFITALSRLQSETGNQVAGLFEQLGLLKQGFTTQQMLALADAAARAAQMARDRAVDTGGASSETPPGSTGGGATSGGPGSGNVPPTVIPEGGVTPYSTNQQPGVVGAPVYQGTPTVSTTEGPVPGGVYRAMMMDSYDPVMAAQAVAQAAAGISSSSSPQYQPVEPASPPPSAPAPITQSMQNYYDAVAERLRKLMEG